MDIFFYLDLPSFSFFYLKTDKKKKTLVLAFSIINNIVIFLISLNGWRIEKPPTIPTTPIPLALFMILLFP